MKSKRIATETFLFWLCAVGLYFMANLQKVVMPGAIWGELQTHFLADAASVAHTGAVFMYAYAFGQLFVGLLIDKYSGMRVITVGAMVLCLGSSLSAFAPSLSLLYVARMLVGLGAASVYLSITKETARLYSASFAQMMGLVMLGGYLGGVMGNAPFIYAVQTYGWQQTLHVTTLAVIAVYVIYCLLGLRQAKPTILSGASFDVKRFGEVMLVKQNWNIVIAGALPFALYFVLQSVIGKKFLEDYTKCTSEQAGWVMTMLMIIGALGSLAAPAVSARLGQRRCPLMRFSAIGTLLAFLCIIGMIAVGFQSFLLAASALVLLAVAGNISPVVVALVRESNRNDNWGVMLSLYTFLAYMATALLGNALGWMLDRFEPLMCEGVVTYRCESYLVVFTMMALLSAASVYSAYHLTEKKETL